MIPASSAHASMPFALPFVTVVFVAMLMVSSSSISSLDRRGCRELLLSPQHVACRTDAERERDRDESHHRGGHEHDVVIPEDVVREGARERRERRAAHVREEDPAV